MSHPSFRSHGQYSYKLQVVFANHERWLEIREGVLDKRLVTIGAAAVKHGYRLSRAAVLANHVRLTPGCDVSESAEQVVFGYMNNRAFVCGMTPQFRWI